MSTQPPSTASRDGQPLYGQAAAELSVLPASAQSPVGVGTDGIRRLPPRRPWPDANPLFICAARELTQIAQELSSAAQPSPF